MLLSYDYNDCLLKVLSSSLPWLVVHYLVRMRNFYSSSLNNRRVKIVHYDDSPVKFVVVFSYGPFYNTNTDPHDH